MSSTEASSAAGDLVGVVHSFSSTELRSGDHGEHFIETGFLRASDCTPLDVAVVRVRSANESIVSYAESGPVDVPIGDQDPLSNFAVSGRSAFQLRALVSGTAEVTSSVDLRSQTMEQSSELKVI